MLNFDWMTVDKEVADDASHATRRGPPRWRRVQAFQENSSAWLTVFGYSFYHSRPVIVRFVVWHARRACSFNCFEYSMIYDTRRAFIFFLRIWRNNQNLTLPNHTCLLKWIVSTKTLSLREKWDISKNLSWSWWLKIQVTSWLALAVSLSVAVRWIIAQSTRIRLVREDIRQRKDLPIRISAFSRLPDPSCEAHSVS